MKSLIRDATNEISGTPYAIKMVVLDMLCLYALVGLTYILVAKSGINLVTNTVTRIRETIDDK